MNENMKSNGWVLCPSKRFPGKFYYFNVVNGETQWSMTDTEAMSLKRHDMMMPEKEYSISDMNSPPNCPYKTEKYTENRHINDQPRSFQPIYALPTMQKYENQIVRPQYQNAIFGQAIFPKPFQNQVTWAPLTMHVNKNDFERDMFVQTTGTLLGQRFTNFEQPFLRFNDKNKIEMTNNANNIAMSSSVAMTNNMHMAMQNNTSMINKNMTMANDVAMSSNIPLTNKMNMANNITIQNNGPMPNDMYIMPEPQKVAMSNIFMPKDMTVTKNMAMPNNMPINRMTVSNNIFMPKAVPNNIVTTNAIMQKNMAMPNDKIIMSNNMTSPNDNMAMPNNIMLLNNMVLSNDQGMPKNMNIPNKIMANNFFAFTPNKTQPYFTNDQLSIASMGMSKLYISNKNITKPILAKPVLNFLPNRQNLKELNTPFSKYTGKTNGDKEQGKTMEILNRDETSNQHDCTEILRNSQKSATYGVSNHKTNQVIPKDGVNSKVTAENVNEEIPIKNSLNIISDENIATEVTTKDKSKISVEVIANKRRKELHDSDLRLVLLAKTGKRRQSMEIDKDECPKGKRIKTSRVEPPPKTVKKHVSFNLEPENLEDIDMTDFYFDEFEEEFENDVRPKDPINEQTMTQNRELWYIVVDTNVLLEHFDFLDNFLKMESNCRLLVPYKVMREVLDLSKGESHDNEIVTIARYRVRWLALPHDNVIIKRVQQENTTEKDIIKCCLDIMKKNAEVKLITNDKKLQANAKINKIKVYNYEEFKEHCIKKPKVNFVREIKISLPNKTETSAHAFRKTLFDEKSALKNGNLELENISSEENSTMFQIQKPSPQKSLTTAKNQNETSTDFPSFQSESTLVINEMNDLKNTPFYSKATEFKTKPHSTLEQNSSIFESAIEKRDLNSTSFENDVNFLNEKGRVKGVSLFDIQDPMLPSENNVTKSVENFKLMTEMLREKIESRQEEFLCHFRQILEECLTYVLSNSSIQNDIKLWNLQESLRCMAYLYSSHPIIKSSSSYINDHLFDDDGKMMKNLKATDVYEIIGHGVVLLKKMQSSKIARKPPNPLILKESEKSLTELLNSIQDPASEVDIEPIRSVCRSELISNNDGRRRNFIKDRSEILDYLKRHYLVWDDEKWNTNAKQNNFNETKVIRTRGNNLSSLKLNKTSMTFKSTNDKPTDDLRKNDNSRVNDTQHDKRTNDSQDDNNNSEYVSKYTDNQFYKTKDNNINKMKNNITEINENKQIPKKTEEQKIVRLFTNKKFEEILKPKTNLPVKVSLQNKIENTGPKVVRNVNMIKSFEDKLKNRENNEVSVISQNSDDCTMVIDENISSDDENDIGNDSMTNNQSYPMSLENGITNDQKNKTQEKTIKMTDVSTKYSQNDKSNDKMNKSKNDTTNKSENDTLNHKMTDKSMNDAQESINDNFAYSTVKSFLFELIETFKLINDFIIRSKDQINNDNQNESQNSLLHEKCWDTYTELREIIEQLKSILQRELSNSRNSLKTLMESSGRQEPIEDHINNYMKIVKKFLEQGQMYENALESIMIKTEKV